jgi:molybdopterin-guanine dinucleotide biosynthesis protein A
MLTNDAASSMPRYAATAIILAGGNSTRMGRDKCFMPIGGSPLIAHISRQLAPHFQEILISANDRQKFAFLGLPVIPDKMPGQGPLMGIASALSASLHEQNFVIACDIPEIPIAFAGQMLQELAGYDAVIPVSGEHLYEPLCAVYGKTVLPALWRAIDNGERKLIAALASCRLHFLPWPAGEILANLNNRSDYENYVAARKKEPL